MGLLFTRVRCTGNVAIGSLITDELNARRIWPKRRCLRLDQRFSVVFLISFFMRASLFVHVAICSLFTRWSFPTTAICRNTRGSFETALTAISSAIYMLPAFHNHCMSNPGTFFANPSGVCSRVTFGSMLRGGSQKHGKSTHGNQVEVDRGAGPTLTIIIPSLTASRIETISSKQCDYSRRRYINRRTSPWHI
jgi:hypothetical protein